MVADGDDGHLFHAFVRAMDGHGIDALEPESSFPNLRPAKKEKIMSKRFGIRGVRHKGRTEELKNLLKIMNDISADSVQNLNRHEARSLRLLYAHPRSASAFFPKHSLRSVHIHLPWAQRDSVPRRAAMVNLKLLLDLCSILEPRGELHIVTDNELLLQEACATLTKSKLFSPHFGFPFHLRLPKSYGTDHLLADRAIVTGALSKPSYKAEIA